MPRVLGMLTFASFTLNYEIKQGKYDMSNVKWNYVDGTLIYDKTVTHKVELTGLPGTLSVIDDGYDGNEFKPAGTYTARIPTSISSKSISCPSFVV